MMENFLINVAASSSRLFIPKNSKKFEMLWQNNQIKFQDLYYYYAGYLSRIFLYKILLLPCYVYYLLDWFL